MFTKGYLKQRSWTEHFVQIPNFPVLALERFASQRGTATAGAGNFTIPLNPPNVQMFMATQGAQKKHQSSYTCQSISENLPQLPSCYVKIAIENGPVKIVDFPIQNGDFCFPLFFACLPEGRYFNIAMERSTIFNGKIHYFNGHVQ